MIKKGFFMLFVNGSNSRFHAIFVAIATLSPPAIYAEMQDSYINLSIGYRHDDTSSAINSYDPPNMFIGFDNVTIKKLHVYEIGLKARYDIWESIFLKGSAYWGSIHNGSYVEEQGVETVQNTSIADANYGNTEDYNIAIGYLFAFNAFDQCFGISPLAGWAYDRQRVKINHANVDGFGDPIIDGAQYITRWQGPWLGIEASFDWSTLSFSLGYEYHWLLWSGQWLLAIPDLFRGAYSDQRSGKGGSGNVLYFDTRWDFLCHWNIGLSLKWLNFRVTKGNEHPKNGNFESIGYNNTQQDIVETATWRSGSITLDLGYCF